MHVRRDDMVMVISGRDNGKTGRVLRAFPKKQRIIVDGLNLVKKHVRRDQSKQEQGGIIQKPASIHVSNVMLYCTKCSRPARVGHRILEDGTRVRYCKKCQEEVTKA